MVVNFATNDLGTFAAAARAAAGLAPHYDVRLVVSHLARTEAFRRALHAVMRGEMDNVLAFQRALGEDVEGALARAEAAEGEDTFSLAPDVQGQLTRKREIMLAHWQEVARLAPRQEEDGLHR